MKQKILAYVLSLVFLFLGSLIPSSLLSGLYYYHILSTQMYEMIALGIGILVFLIAGFVLGKKTTKKALFHALLFVVPFLLIATLSKDFNLNQLVISLGKGITYIIGTVVGVNLQARR